MDKTKFNFRSFTSLILVWTFIIQMITGIVLYIVPPGRIANWTNWNLFGIDKAGWEALHTIFGYLFIIFGILHISYNWRPIINYVKKKIKTGFRLRKELIISIIIIIAFSAGILLNVVPFKNVMDFGDKLKNSWSLSEEEPVIPHLELKSFEEFTNTIGIDIDEAKNILKAKEIVVTNNNEKLFDIAKKYNTSPDNIYSILIESIEHTKTTNKTDITGETEGQGYGRKTIDAISNEYNVNPEKIINLLKNEGIIVTKDQTLKEISNKYNKSVPDLMEMIKNKLK